MSLRTQLMLVYTVGLNDNPSVRQCEMPWRLSSLMALLIEVWLTQTVRVVMPLFWTICIPFSSHPLFLYPFRQQVTTETTGDVRYICFYVAVCGVLYVHSCIMLSVLQDSRITVLCTVKKLSPSEVKFSYDIFLVELLN